MDPTPPRAARQPAPAGGVGRVFRYLYRFPLLLLHIVLLLPPTLLCLAPPLRAIGWGNETLGERAVRAWSAGLMWIFGFRLRRFGTPLPGATMFVANHVSWVDIEILHSQRMINKNFL